MDNWRGDMIPIGMPHHNTSFELVTFDSLYVRN